MLSYGTSNTYISNIVHWNVNFRLCITSLQVAQVAINYNYRTKLLQLNKIVMYLPIRLLKGLLKLTFGQ